MIRLIYSAVMLIVTMVTTIQIEDKTRDRLLTLGKKGETYDQIINRLLGWDSKTE